MSGTRQLESATKATPRGIDCAEIIKTPSDFEKKSDKRPAQSGKGTCRKGTPWLGGAGSHHEQPRKRGH